MHTSTVHITGSSGYLGTELFKYFSRLPMNINKIDRINVEKNRPTAGLPYSLENPNLDFSSLSKGIFIHCAWDKTQSRNKYFNVNVEGSIRTLQAAKKNPLINSIFFISSTSSYPNALSTYGRSKYSVEQFARQNGIFILRPGLLFTNQNSGPTLEGLRKLTKLFPIFPLIDNGEQKFHFTHVHDLASTILKMDSDPPSYTENLSVLANATPISFKEIVTRLYEKDQRKPRFLNIKQQLASHALTFLGKLPTNFPFSTIQLESLLDLPTEYEINKNICANFNMWTP